MAYLNEIDENSLENLKISAQKKSLRLASISFEMPIRFKRANRGAHAEIIVTRLY